MGKVKERKLKLESRKEEREALKNQIEEAERNKRIECGDYSSDEDNEDDVNNDNNDLKIDANDEKKEEMVTFQDEITEDLFGSHVVVTTIYGLPSSDEDEEETEKDKSKKQRMGNNDRRQQYAGSVKKYIDKFTRQLPAKKKKSEHKGAKKGQHGASKMIGGSATDLKSAQKFLSRAQQNQKGKSGAEGKKRKKKR
jgi:hypothetical protein